MQLMIAIGVAYGKNGDSFEITCSGIREYACGGSSAGFIYPICILILGLYDSEMPNEEFVVVNVEGLGMNGRIDTRNKEVGYLCFVKKNFKQLYCFDWFYNNVTYPNVVAIRKRYNAFYDDDTEHNGEEPQQIHQDKFVLWGDSDISYLQQMTNPARVEDSMKKGIYFSNIGAKIAETSQPLDRGPFFKILEMSCRNSTYAGSISDMTLSVDKMFKKLSINKDVVLSIGKLNTLKDCIICTPEMMTNAFTTRTIQKAVVSSGILDHRMKLCPDLHGIIQSLKVNWSKVEGDTTWFKKQIPSTILEMYKCGEITESFYDDTKFPIDFDLKGNIYKLNSNDNNMNRSTVLYHPRILADKRAVIKKAIDLINEDQDSMVYDATRLLVVNKQCEAKLIALCGGEDLTNYTTMIQDKLTHEIIHKCSAMLLNVFIKVRILKYLIEAYIMPKKGDPDKVLSGLVDKKTKGSFMIALSYYCRSKPIIGVVPILQESKLLHYSSNHQKSSHSNRVYTKLIAPPAHFLGSLIVLKQVLLKLQQDN